MEIIKSRKKRRAKSDSVLDIEDVIQLGGDQSDIEFLKDIDEDDEMELQDDDSDGESLKSSEVQEFIAKLGFQKLLNIPTKDRKAEAVKEEGFGTKISKKSKQDLLSERTKNVELKEVSVTDVLDRFQSYHARNCLLLKPGVKWFDYQFSTDPVASAVLSKSIIKKLEEFGSRVMQDEVALYRKQQEVSKKSSVGWLKTVLTSGTQADKMAAMVLQIQEAPIHNLSSLDSLIAMVKKKSRRESLQVLDTLKELFLSDLLPENSKLKAFDQHPWCNLDQLSSGNKDTYDKRVLIWYFESQLKQKYAEFVAVLETLSHDAVEAVRKKSLNVILHLLCERPEQEKQLLSMLVNKLGDPDYKIAANASHLLSQLIAKHPVMKTVVVGELERLLYRPNISVKAQYYGVCFLNQLMLSDDEKQLALRLLTIYFSFFKVFVKKGEVESKILSALLTGVNRAYPYAKPDKDNIMAQVDTLYKIVHISQFNTSVQALMLIYQVIDISDSTSDRYFVALYRKLRDPELQSSTKLTMFLNLLFKSLKYDVLEKRVHAFVKRLLQVSQSFSPPFICAALYMLSELLKVRPKLMVLNKVYSKFDAGIDDDEEEHFVDVLDEENDAKSISLNECDSKLVPAVSSWIHRKYAAGSTRGAYDPHHRNPLYCHADTDCSWELMSFVNHYHPSVALFARMLLSAQSITYSGDPLEDFTLMRFVDRFVYRNPKKVKEKMKVSVQSAGVHHAIKGTLAGDIRKIPVNSDIYLQKNVDQIPADELFFYKFFSRQSASRKLTDEVDSDADDVSDDEFDEFLDKFEHGMADTDLDMDFAMELNKSKCKESKKSRKKVVEEEPSSEDDIDEDLSDEEVEFDDEDFKMDFVGDADGNGDVDEFDEEQVAFSDEDDDFKAKSKRQKLTSSKSKLPKNMDTSLFAAADEFSHLMEDDADLGHMIGTQAVSRKDNAGRNISRLGFEQIETLSMFQASHCMKQIKWEMDRDSWVKDKRWKKKHSEKRPTRGAKLKSTRK